MGGVYLALLLSLGCRRGDSPAEASGGQRALAQQQRELNDQVRVQLETIAPPVKSRYMAIKSLTAWQNPYLTVQDNLLVLHVTVADANTSALGQGGMLRPTGARRQDLTIRVGELSAALNAVPTSAWPYGRVMAVEEAHNTPASVEPAVRRTMEGVIRTLGDLGVVAYEWNEGGARCVRLWSRGRTKRRAARTTDVCCASKGMIEQTGRPGGPATEGESSNGDGRADY